MTLFAPPWLELAVAVPLAGAGCVRLVRDPRPAFWWCLGFAAATLGCATAASVEFYSGRRPAGAGGGALLTVNELTAPLLPLVALLHLLVAVTTTRTMTDRGAPPWLLAGAAVRLALLACASPWALVGLLAVECTLPYVEIRRRGRPGRLFAVHAVVFVGLLAAGWACVDGAGWVATGSVLVLAAALLRTGAFPAQVWVTDVFEKASFGTALMFATPLVGVYAAVRLVLPVAPEWALEAVGVAALATAVYAAGMGVVEHDARRFFAYLFVSHAALVLVGLGLDTPLAVTGALVMWPSAALALTGLGLTLRAIKARVGTASLTEYRGLYEHAPALAVGFLLTGLAAVGFPGTSGFVAVELLVDEAVGSHEAFGLAVVLVAALNGIAVVRAYLLLFTGRRHETGVSLGATPLERAALLVVTALILGGGLFPQLYLDTRRRAAGTVLHVRHGEADRHPVAPATGP